MRYPTIAILCIWTAIALRAQPVTTTVITGGTLIDGNGGAPISDAVVVVSAGRITSAGPRSSVAVSASA